MDLRWRQLSVWSLDSSGGRLLQYHCAVLCGVRTDEGRKEAVRTTGRNDLTIAAIVKGKIVI